MKVITLNGTDSSQLFGEDNSVAESDIDIINMILYIKDRHIVSGCALFNPLTGEFIFTAYDIHFKNHNKLIS